MSRTSIYYGNTGADLSNEEIAYTVTTDNTGDMIYWNGDQITTPEYYTGDYPWINPNDWIAPIQPTQPIDPWSQPYDYQPPFEPNPNGLTIEKIKELLEQYRDLEEQKKTSEKNKLVKIPFEF